MKNNICVICLRPRKVWLDFFAAFTHYKVYFIIDDNAIGYAAEYGDEYPTLNFIQVKDDKHIHSHFRDIDFPNEILTGWHKALYYFANENLDFDNTWFIEDDVFFHDENTLRMIDDKYSDSDYLSNSVTEYDGSSDVWHWYKISMKYEHPWYNAMVCAARLSRTLLQKINEYAQTHQTLFFIEAMFPTVARKNDLICNSPVEMTHIYYRDHIDLNSIRPDMLYHPMKCVDLYPDMRRFINDKFFQNSSDTTSNI